MGTAVMVEGEVVDVGVDEVAGEADIREVGVVDMVVEEAGTVAAAADGNPLRAVLLSFFGPAYYL